MEDESSCCFFLFFFFASLSFLFQSSEGKKKELSYRERVVRDEVDRGLRDLEAEGLVGVLKVELFVF